jgi:RNA polymerase sigma-70 factor (ECF subfamily)
VTNSSLYLAGTETSEVHRCQIKAKWFGLKRLLCRIWAPHTTLRAGWYTTNTTLKTWFRKLSCGRLSPFSGYYGGNSRAWVLTIVRNACYTWLQQNRILRLAEPIEDNLDEVALDFADPEILLLRGVDSEIVRQALEELPVEFCEVVVLREMEGLSYKEIANVVDLPLGTGMSRLARGRKRLQALLASRMGKEGSIELSANA